MFDIPEGASACAVCGYKVGQPGAETAPPADGADAAAPQTSSAPAPALTELDARRELAHEFRIEALLQPGNGVSMIVYLAYDPRQDRQVEVKVVPRQPLRDAGAEERFRRAADAAAALDHPHIIPIYRCGATVNFLWFSTKHVQGRTVAELVRTNGPMELGACQRILEQAASALDAAHRRGVVHGALTPANVIIDANEWVLVGDFSVAEVAATSRAAAEVFNARGPTPSADQRALAALAYECLSGSPPAGEAVPKLSDVRPEVPPHVSEALRRALSARPAERFPTVLDFVAALGGTSAGAGPGTPLFSLNPHRGPGSPVVIMDFEPEPRRVARRLAAVAGLVLVLGAGGVWLTLSSLPAAPSLPRSVERPPAAAPAPTPIFAAPPPPPPPEPPVSAPQDTLVTLATAPRDTALTPAYASRDTQPTPPMSRSLADRLSPPARAPAPRPAAPRVTRISPPPPPPRTTVAKQAPPPVAVDRQMELARLSVNSIPWGTLYVDGQLIGIVPQTDLPIWPGTHALRVEREGFQPYERTFEVGPGQRLKITDIVLRDLTP